MFMPLIANARHSASGLALLLVLILCGVSVAQAAPPTFQAAGVGLTGRNALSPAWPAHQVDDIALLLVQTANQTTDLSTPAGFTAVANSPQGTGTAGGSTATRISVFWARATSAAMPTPTVADSGNNQVAQILTFRGVDGVGNPWDVTAGGVLATASSAFSIPGATTTISNDLVVAIVANAKDSNVPQTSGYSNASLSGLVEITDFNGNSGNGGGFGAAAGVMVAAGTYGSTTGTLANATVQGLLSIALRPKTTTLGDGSNPANATLAPGAAITDLDSFTLRTSSGTDSVSALTVTLTGGNAFQGLSDVRITSSNGATTYFSAVANPGSNTLSFSGGTPIPVSTTLTTFKVRITPKTHPNMPVPPGLSYPVGGTITAFTVVNENLGSDGASATITVDNLSPTGATAVSGSPGDTQVTLNWTTSVSADFSRSVMLRWTGAAAGAEVPVEGIDYVVGNSIGAATVACLRTGDSGSIAVSGTDGGGGNCSAAALVNGQAYTYRIFQKDSNGNYDTGVAVGTYTPANAVGGFNAYESSTAAGAISGVIKTKVSGASFSLDVIALNSARTAILTSFTGEVQVQLLDSSSGGVLDANGCNVGWPLIQTLASNPVFVAGDNGRKAVAFQENNVWRNVRVRISYPTGVATAIGCSSNAFAIRPSAFASVSVRDADSVSAGTTRNLTNTTASGGVVHKAGQNFRIDATAVNSAGVATSGYVGVGPGASLTACLLPTSLCTLGTLSTGSWSIASGALVTSTATYTEAGAFTMKLQDTTFAAVDNADSSTAERYIESAAFNVGRFVPNHFTLSTANTPTLKTFNDATCATRSFTYIGQPFGYVTAPQALITAQNSAGGTTTNYNGALWRPTAAYTYTPAAATLDSSMTTAPALLSSNNGTGTATVAGTDVLAYVRSLTTPQALFTANVSLSLSVADSSEAAVTGNGTISTTTPALFDGGGTGIAFDAGKEFRYGRLTLGNAHGSELLDLPVPLATQYWNGTTFVANAADNCTSIAAANISLGNFQKNLSAGETTVSISGRFTAGKSNLKLSKPGAGNNGSVDLTVNLGATGANKTYLRGKWSGINYDLNPSGRASFGIYKSADEFIYMREIY